MSVSVVVRRIAATPARPATEVWAIISALLAPAGSIARHELEQAAGVAMSLIADEAIKDSPIVVYGVGPRLRIYCLYDDEAVLGEAASEAALAWCPTDGDWRMSVPCPQADLHWIQDTLARTSTRITARDIADPVPEADASMRTEDLGIIDMEAFLRS